MKSLNTVCLNVGKMLDSKCDVSQWDIALRIVNDDLGLANFIGEENILGKGYFNFAGSLVHAAHR